MITGPGEYKMRNGNLAVVAKYVAGTPFPYRGSGDDSWTNRGFFLLRVESPRDIIGPWVEPVAEPEPFAITGLGSYVLRDGSRVEVLRHKLRGFWHWWGEARCWGDNGRLYMKGESPFDIVGPWPEPVEMCERDELAKKLQIVEAERDAVCKQRDKLHYELIQMRARVMLAVK